MKMDKKTNRFLIILIISLISVAIAFNNKNYTPPVQKNIVVITVDDVSPAFSLEQHKRLFSILDSFNATATLFVIPQYLGRISYTVTLNDEWINLMKEEQRKGHEIAQEGYYHTENEFALLDYNQSIQKLTAGRNLLEQVFGPVCGWRAPYWTENYFVTQALNDLKYCYDADLTVSPFSHGLYGEDWVTNFVTTQLEYKLRSASNKPLIVVLHVQKLDEQVMRMLRNS